MAKFNPFGCNLKMYPVLQHFWYIACIAVYFFALQCICGPLESVCFCGLLRSVYICGLLRSVCFCGILEFVCICGLLRSVCICGFLSLCVFVVY